MKGQLISTEDKAELVLEDGRIFKSKKNETPDDLYARVAGVVDNELMEPLEISVEITDDKLKRRSSVDLKKKLKNGDVSTLEKRIITEILSGRGEMEVAAETVETVIAEAGTSIDARKQAAREFVGRTCAFVPRNAKDEIPGVIKGIMADKRVDSVYFRIEDGQGNIYHKRVASEDLKIL